MYSYTYGDGHAGPIGDTESNLANQENNTEEKIFHFLWPFNGRKPLKRSSKPRPGCDLLPR